MIYYYLMHTASSSCCGYKIFIILIPSSALLWVGGLDPQDLSEVARSPHHVLWHQSGIKNKQTNNIPSAVVNIGRGSIQVVTSYCMDYNPNSLFFLSLSLNKTKTTTTILSGLVWARKTAIGVT